MATSNPKIIFVSREQAFRFELSGLMPLTVHYFYFERQQVLSTKLKPEGGKVGDPLVTDQSGKIVFDYYYDSGITPESPVEKAQQQAILLAGTKEVVLTNINSGSITEGFQNSSLSYYRGHIRINVFVPPESEYKQIAAVVSPAPAWYDDGGSGGGSTG